MIWGFSPNQMKSLSDGEPLTEQDIQKALSAQYRSTYRVDFLGLPQGERSYCIHISLIDLQRCSY